MLTKRQPYKRWRPEETTRLGELAREGLTLRQIAVKLRRPYGTVYRKVKEYGITVKFGDWRRVR